MGFPFSGFDGFAAHGTERLLLAFDVLMQIPLLVVRLNKFQGHPALGALVALLSGDFRVHGTCIKCPGRFAFGLQFAFHDDLVLCWIPEEPVPTLL